MTNAEIIRGLRAKAVAEGRCQTCRCRPALPSVKWCRVCADRSKQARIARNKRRKGKDCTRCGASVGRMGRSACQACADKEAKHALARGKRKRAAGVCANCKSTVVPGRSRCQIHLDAERDRQLAISRASGAYPKDCSNCGNPGHDRRTCARWHERAVIASTKDRPATSRTKKGSR